MGEGEKGGRGRITRIKIGEEVEIRSDRNPLNRTMNHENQNWRGSGDTILSESVESDNESLESKLARKWRYDLIRIRPIGR